MWKAATLIELGRASFTSAGLEVMDAAGLLIAGRREILVEKARWETAAKQVCLSIAGWAIEAMTGMLRLLSTFWQNEASRCRRREPGKDE